MFFLSDQVKMTLPLLHMYAYTQTEQISLGLLFLKPLNNLTAVTGKQ